MKKVFIPVLAGLFFFIITFGVFMLVAKVNYDKNLREFSGSNSHCFFMPYKNSTSEVSFLLASEKSVTIKLGSRTIIGSIRLQIVDKNGNIVLSQQGRDISLIDTIQFPEGEYTAHIEFNNAMPASAVFTITPDEDSSSHFISKVNLDSAQYEKINPGPNDSFNWPYYLYLPEKQTCNTLLVVPNNSGFVSDQLIYHEESARSTIQWVSRFGDELGCPVLVPVFPRWAKEENIYTHALDRDTFTTTQEDIQRLDLQLISMMENASALLEIKQRPVEEKIFMFGFSASGMFSNRFTVLHPNKVKAAAIGSPGGWPIAPVEYFEGNELRYPIGIYDVYSLTGENVNMDALKQVPMYIFTGREDTNDSVPYEDGYEPEDAALVMDIFGRNPLERWPYSEDIYKNSGCDSHFVIYEQVGHSISEEMKSDIIEFFHRNINQ